MRFDQNKAKHIIALKELASDIFAGYVFTDHHINESRMKDMFGIVFPVLFASKEVKDKLENETGLVYEYMSESLPKSDWVDGYPVFKSFRFLSKEDAELVRGFVNGLVAEKKMKAKRNKADSPYLGGRK